MAKSPIKVGPYTLWRDGRPRFIPGPRERAMGFKGQDLKQADGRWFTMDEAHGFAMARQQEITAQRKTGRKLKTPPVPRGRAVKDLWDAYIASNEFKGNARLKIAGLAASTQASYKRWVRPLEQEAIWLAPIGALDPVVLKALHERMQTARGQAMARCVIAALQAALAWGRLRGWLPKIGGHTINNPASRLDLPAPPVRLRVGTDVEISALVAAADRTDYGGVSLAAIGDAVLTGFFSGQRKKDVLEFEPGSTSNNRIELVQSKTKARVSIPMAPRLVDRIAASRARRAKADYRVVSRHLIINEVTGQPYNSVTFRLHFALVRAAAIAGVVDEEATTAARAAHAAERRNGELPTVYTVEPCKTLADFTFPDLRDTAVTWYARAGATVPEIASITGHSLKSVYTILKHYLALDAHLADNAVAKLVDYMEREGLAV